MVTSVGSSFVPLILRATEYSCIWLLLQPFSKHPNSFEGTPVAISRFHKQLRRCIFMREVIAWLAVGTELLRNPHRLAFNR